MAMGRHGGINRSGRGGRGRRAAMAEINVTPLVDVMLVLLIIFMITAPLMVAGVPVDLPDSRAKPIEQPDAVPVQISIDAKDRIFIDDREVSNRALPAELAKIAAAQAGKAKPQQIMLRADRKREYGRVMRVMGELNRAGLTRIAMVTTGSDSEE
jgi:biopolymer transport protein TolR